MENIEVFSKRCKSMLRVQKDMIKFLVKYEGKWHTFGKDRDTVEVVCSLVNLGIAKIETGQMTLKSRKKADRLLSSRE